MLLNVVDALEQIARVLALALQIEEPEMPHMLSAASLRRQNCRDAAAAAGDEGFQGGVGAAGLVFRA